MSAAVPPAPPRGRLRGGPEGDTARALLLTVLGELVLPSGAAARTSSLISVLGGFEVEEKATRQALSRVAKRGWLRAEREGREARWRLTPEGVELLSTGAERIYSFGGEGRRWDGRWLVLLVSVPESRRRLRHHLRTRLGWAGFGSPAPGVWISPRADRAAEAAAVLRGLRLEGATSFVATMGEVGDPVALVAQAWDLRSLASGYTTFVEGPAAATPGSADETLQALLRLVHAWRRFPALDPDLPAELLPPGWPGTAAAARFRDRHRRWSAVAGGRWAELDRGGPAQLSVPTSRS